MYCYFLNSEYTSGNKYYLNITYILLITWLRRTRADDFYSICFTAARLEITNTAGCSREDTVATSYGALYSLWRNGVGFRDKTACKTFQNSSKIWTINDSSAFRRKYIYAYTSVLSFKHHLKNQTLGLFSATYAYRKCPHSTTDSTLIKRCEKRRVEGNTPLLRPFAIWRTFAMAIPFQQEGCLLVWLFFRQGTMWVNFHFHARTHARTHSLTHSLTHIYWIVFRSLTIAWNKIQFCKTKKRYYQIMC